MFHPEKILKVFHSQPVQVSVGQYQTNHSGVSKQGGIIFQKVNIIRRHYFFGMVNVGNLWLPDEIEVYGMPVQGGKTYVTTSNAVQYPIFAGNMRRIKYAGNSGGRAGC